MKFENVVNFMEPKKIDHNQERVFGKPLSEQLNPKHHLYLIASLID